MYQKQTNLFATSVPRTEEAFVELVESALSVPKPDELEIYDTNIIVSSLDIDNIIWQSG